MDLQGAPAFTAEVYFFEESLGLQAKERAGPGNGPWTTGRPYGPHGRLVIKALAVCHGFPLPLDFPEKHPTGTIALQHDQGGTTGLTKKQTVQVRVDGGKVSLAKDRDDGWNLELVCTLLDAPVFTGFGGTQPTTTPAVFTDQELFAGRTKLHDPNNLIEAATRSWDVIPLPTGDAAELTRFALLVANADAPFPGAKVKFARLEANRDNDGGTVFAQYNLTDTAEDVVNPATSTTIDPNALTSSGSAAAINTTPTPPGNAELVERETTTQEIHDTATLYRTSYGVTTTKEDRQFPQTHADDDPQNLEDWASDARVFTTGAPPLDLAIPAGLKLHHRFDVPVTHLLSLRVWMWRKLDTVDERVYPATQATLDPSDLTTNSTTATVYDTASPPGDPTPPTGQRLAYLRTHPATTTKSVRVYVFEKDTSAEKLIQQHGQTVYDPENLTSTAARAALDSAPSPPGGFYVLRLQRSVNVTHDHILYVNEYGVRSTLDDEQMDGSGRGEDPQDLVDDEVIAVVTSTSAPSATPAGGAPTGLKKRDVKTKQLTPSLWRHTYVYSRRDHADDLLMDAWEAIDDPDDLEETGVVLQITASVTPPATPASPVVNGKYLRTRTKKIHDRDHAGGTGKWAHTFYYGPRTSSEDITLPKTTVGDDPAGLKDQDTKAIIDVNLVAPAPPANAKGLLHYDTETVQLHALPTPKYVHLYRYRRQTSKDEIEQAGTSATYATARGGERETTSIIDSSDADWVGTDGSANGIAAKVFARLKNDVTFDWVRVIKENAARARRVIQSTDDMQIVDVKAQGGKWPTKAILGGFSVLVWLAQKRRRGTGLWIASVEPQSLHQFSMTFTLRRRLVDGNIAPGLLVGTSNLNPFLGLPARSVTYMGAALEYNRLIASPRVLPFDFVFRFESLGVFDDTGVRCGHFITDADLSGVNANEWVDAGTFGWPASPLPTYDYGVFLT